MTTNCLLLSLAYCFQASKYSLQQARASTQKHQQMPSTIIFGTVRWNFSAKSWYPLLFQVFFYQKLAETPKNPRTEFFGTEEFFEYPLYDYGNFRTRLIRGASADFELFSTCFVFFFQSSIKVKGVLGVLRIEKLLGNFHISYAAVDICGKFWICLQKTFTVV